MHLLKYTAGKNLSGYGFTFAPDVKSIERETVSCCHCQFTWHVEPGSGKTRGWCFLCNKPVCGKKACRDTCSPWEKQCEQMEAKARARASYERVSRK